MNVIHDKLFALQLQCYQDAHVAFAAEKSRLEEEERERKRKEEEERLAKEAEEKRKEEEKQAKELEEKRHAEELEKRKNEKEEKTTPPVVVAPVTLEKTESKEANEKEDSVDEKKVPEESKSEETKEMKDKVDEVFSQREINPELLKWNGREGIVPYWLDVTRWEEEKLDQEIFQNITNDDALKPSKKEWDDYFYWLENVIQYSKADVDRIRNQQIWQRTITARLCFFLHFLRCEIPMTLIKKGYFGTASSWEKSKRIPWKNASFVSVPIMNNSIDYWCTNDGVSIITINIKLILILIYFLLFFKFSQQHLDNIQLQKYVIWLKHHLLMMMKLKLEIK